MIKLSLTASRPPRARATSGHKGAGLARVLTVAVLLGIFAPVGAQSTAGSGGATGTGTPPQLQGSAPEAGGRPTEQTVPPLAQSTPLPVATPAPATEFHFYIRSTFANADGEAAKPFIAPGAPAKYRLGNEPELYSELSVLQRVYRAPNGLTVSGLGMLGLSGGVNRTPFGDVDDSRNNGFPQAYVQAENIPRLPGARVWVGRLYYRRTDVHINDFFYWNPSGQGAGIENVPVGRFGLSYAYFDKEAGKSIDRADRHDFQLSGYSPNRDSNLRLGLSLVRGKGAGARDGYAITVQHLQLKVLKGANRVVAQYGRGASAGYAGLSSQISDITQGNNSRSYRVLDVLDFNTKGRFNGQAAAIYQRNRDTSDGIESWFSLGARPVYAFGKNFKLAIELGHDRITPYNGDARNLTKLTIAPTLTKGPGFYERPELRFFYTYAKWNGAAQNAASSQSALSTTGPYGFSRNGSTVGVQFETWF